jgi:hypothetical protein
MLINSVSEKHIEIDVGPIPDFAQLEQMWIAMDLVGQHSFFLTWQWIGSWLRSLASFANLNLIRITIQNELVGLAIIGVRDDRLQGIIPVRRAWLHATGEAEQDRITIEYNGIACKEEWADEIWEALANWFCTNFETVHELTLPGCKQSLISAINPQCIVSDNPQRGFRCSLDEVRNSAGLGAILTRNSRQKLSRSHRQCEKLGALALTVASNFDQRREFLLQMSQLHTASWQRRGDAGAFLNDYFNVFCHELIRNPPSDRAVQLLRLSAGSRSLGYLMNFEHRGVVYNYQSGFDDSDRALRPGYVAHAFAIRHYADRGLKYYDFLAKENQLKRSFCTEDYVLHWQRLRKPILAFRAEQIIRNLIRR